MLRFTPLIALLLATPHLSAADFSGQWAGTIERNGGRIPFYLTLNLNEGTLNGFASSGTVARNLRIESSELRDDGLSFAIHDDANRLMQFRLTLTNGVLGGEATAGTEVWKVAIVPVRSLRQFLPPAAVLDSGVGSGSGVGNSVYRVGGGVSAPLVIHKVSPEYSEEARAAKLEGTALLYVEIAPDGTATNIKLQRTLGMGLDQKAIEAVKQWKFKPGEKDGKPVTVAATIAVNFRL